MYTKGQKMRDARKGAGKKGTGGSLEKLSDIEDYRIIGVKGQFSKSAAKKFGVRTATSEADGTTPIASYFPYYDQNNNLVGYKKRDWTLAKEDDYHFTAIGKVSASCKMFGQSKFSENPKKIIVVEGEGDVLNTWTVLEKVMKDKGFTQSYAVVGLPAGTVNAAQAASANEKWLLSGQELLLGLDNDERFPHEKRNVKRGKEATEDIFNVLMSNKIKKITWPEGCKDAKDYAFKCLDPQVEDHGQSQFYDLVMYGAHTYMGAKIIKPSSLSFSEMDAPKPFGVMIESFPLLMDQTRGIRKNELTLVTAPSGVGKSTVTSEIMYGLLEKGKRIGVIYLEETAKETLQRIQARKLEVNFNKYKFNPKDFKTIEERKAAWDWICDEESDKITLVDHFGSLMTKDLMDKIRALTFIDKVDFIILDHISMVISGNETDNERKDIDILMTQLAAFVVPNDVGIIAISHLNRDGTKYRPPAGKENEPFWIRVRKEDLRGSASLEQLCFNIWGVEGEVLPDRSRGRVRLVNLKNRPCGILGEADVVAQDQETGLFFNAADESFD